MLVKDCWTEVEGVATHYLRAGGTGSALVLLHGGELPIRLPFPGDPTMDLFSRSHRVIAPDLPGYGASAKPDLNYTVEYYTRFSQPLGPAAGSGAFFPGGLSMGGHIAVVFALQFPSMVEKLVLADSAGLGTQWYWQVLGKLMVKNASVAQKSKENGESRNHETQPCERLFITGK